MSEREPYDEKLPLHEGWTRRPSDERARLPLTGEKRAWLQARAHNTGQILHGHPWDEQLWADLSEGVMSLLTEWKSEHAARLEAEARVEAWRTLAKDAVEAFEDARGYASTYFTEKWGYDETSASFVATITVLETGGEGPGVFEQMGMDEPRLPELRKDER